MGFIRGASDLTTKYGSTFSLNDIYVKLTRGLRLSPITNFVRQQFIIPFVIVHNGMRNDSKGLKLRIMLLQFHQEVFLSWQLINNRFALREKSQQHKSPHVIFLTVKIGVMKAQREHSRSIDSLASSI